MGEVRGVIGRVKNEGQKSRVKKSTEERQGKDIRKDTEEIKGG